MSIPRFSLKELAAVFILTFLASMVFSMHAQTLTTSSPRPTITNENKSGQFGVGVEVGTATGLTADYWNSSRTSWNGGIESGFGLFFFRTCNALEFLRN